MHTNPDAGPSGRAAPPAAGFPPAVWPTAAAGAGEEREAGCRAAHEETTLSPPPPPLPASQPPCRDATARGGGRSELRRVNRRLSLDSPERDPAAATAASLPRPRPAPPRHTLDPNTTATLPSALSPRPHYIPDMRANFSCAHSSCARAMERHVCVRRRNTAVLSG